MSQTDSTENKTKNRVLATSHPRVYYMGTPFNRGELEIATTIADRIDDDWRIVITIGPYRPHNLQYQIIPDSHIVQLDFYSVRPHGGEYEIDVVIEAIQTGISEAEQLG